jgi:hypothetical protein
MIEVVLVVCMQKMACIPTKENEPKVLVDVEGISVYPALDNEEAKSQTPRLSINPVVTSL